MKLRILFLLFSFAIFNNLAAQNANSCYADLRREGVRLLEKKDYRNAIDKFFAARYCPDKPAKDDLDDLIQRTQNQWVKALDDAKKATVRALAKADSLIAYFGFAQDRAWAYKNGKFAVIDRSGKRLTDFEFENPESFKESGYAIAQKADGFYYLIDKTGKVSEPYNYFFPCNNGWYKVKKGNLYTFYDKNYRQVEGWGWYEAIGNFDRGLAKMKKNGKWGLINNKGKIITSPVFDEIGDSFFADRNIAKVKQADKWGIIDRNGRFILEPNYYQIEFYSFDCKLRGAYSLKYNGKYGLLNQDYKIWTDTLFDRRPECQGDFIFAMQGNQYQLFDSTLKVLIPAEIGTTLNFLFDQTVTHIQKDNKWGFFVKSNYKIIAPQFDSQPYFDNGVASVYKNGKVGFINLEGTFIIPPQYDKAYRPIWGDHIFTVEIGGKQINIDRNNQLLDYAPRGPYREGLAAISQNGKEGYIDKKGETVIPPQFDYADIFKNGLANIQVAGKWGTINKKGEMVIPPQFDEKYAFKNGFARVKKGNQFAIMDTTGHYIIQFKDQQIDFEAFNGNLIWVKDESDKWGLMNKQGQSIVSPRYDRIYFGENGALSVVQNGKHGVVDEMGRILISPQFDSVYMFIEYGTATSYGEEFRISHKGELIVDETLEPQKK